METEQKLGQAHGATQGLSPIAQALVKQSSQYFNTDYGLHADLLGVGGADAHHPHILMEVEHVRM